MKSSSLIAVIITAMSLVAKPSLAEEATFDDIEFVKINSQTFTFGSGVDQANRNPNEEPYAIEMSHSFWMGKFEVSQAVWQDVMGYNPSVHQSLGPIDTLPVDSVSWEEIQTFVDRLNETAGGEYYRLPTEAEWEFVARAGTDTAWSFGDDVSQLSTYAFRDGDVRPRPVGSKEPNSLAVYDLYGNVYEWVEDWFAYDRDVDYGACPPRGGDFKVIRGGSNASLPKFLRSSSRNFAAPSSRSWQVGFRLVRVLDPAADRFRSGEVCVQSWNGASSNWGADGGDYARYTWAEAGIVNNGRGNAQAYCVASGGTLARPNSQAAWDALYNNLPRNGSGWWIDGHNNFSCGISTNNSRRAYQYGTIYVPNGTNGVYTGCNCTNTEQGLVAYFNVDDSTTFDGCQERAGINELGLMDEQLTYGHGRIEGFVCER